MSVDELLKTHTSYQLAEWHANARVNGLSDPELFEVLAGIHEQIQLTNHLLGAAHFTDGEDGENPIPAPRRLPRAGERLPVEDDEE
jgi:hypothetical protein